jgi:TPR repeat protein
MRRNHVLVVASLFAALIGRPCSGQPVPLQYQRFFVRNTDNRSLPEKALNAVGLTGQDVGRSFALIAGVTRYPNMQSLYQELNPAAADLKNLQSYLRDQEFFDEIVILKDGDMNYENLRYFLEVYFPDRLKRSPKSRFLFAYSGHGISEGTNGYLLLSTAGNLQDKRNSISLNIVRDLVDATVEAGYQVLVLINACYSGGFLRRSFGPTSYLPKYPGAHAITAGGAKELSWHDGRLGEGSVFFEKVLAGLGGQADASPLNPDGTRGDGIVTVDELATYLKQEIRIFSDQHQNPMEGDLSKDGSLGGFFFLNRGRQVARGNVRAWSPVKLSPFGIEAEQEFIEAKRLYSNREYTIAKPLFERAATAGNLEAAAYLGVMYDFALGVLGDSARASQWYGKAAVGGNAWAMNNLGLCYEAGKGVPQDYALARQWYESAAAAGEARGMYGVGSLYGNGSGVAKDYTIARQWYEKAAAAGSALAMYSLGNMYQFGQGVPRDFAVARQWYENAVAAGSALAMGGLGDLSRFGQGVPRDFAVARQWYEKAIAAGDDMGATDDLGELYRWGQGVPQDYGLARQWYEKAAAAGNSGAMNHLGELYYYGLGTPRDFAVAHQWYNKAAAAGNAEAMNNLGHLHRYGQGARKDLKVAYQWYNKAAAAGNAEAMNNIGELCDFDNSAFRTDYKLARNWYEKAAAAGNASAMHNLGVLYERGDGVQKDYALARQWYENAVAAGSDSAKERLKKLGNRGRNP